MSKLNRYKNWRYEPTQPFGKYGANWRVKQQREVVIGDESKILVVDVNDPSREKAIEKFKNKVDELIDRYPNLTPS